MPETDAKPTFLDRLIEIGEVIPIHANRVVNAGFKFLLGGTAVERSIREMRPVVASINELEPDMMRLSDTELSKKTEEFRNRQADGETLDELLPEAFAAVREAARRLEGHPYPKRHFDVQMIGGIVLHRGKIAEMITGEGKTLVATLSAYLNALSGHPVHVVTVNDYLARRDAAWMSPVYEFLGLSVGAIQSDMDPDIRKPIYACNIVYGTNNEFGFDYLRDNMKVRVEDQVQRELNYAIIDEVDSVLIDEARTPLIISGMPEGTTEKYYIANRAAQRLRKSDHYEVKEKERTVVMNEPGILAAQKAVGVNSFYTGKNVDWPHYMDNALKAKELYRRDREYVVREGEVIIVDEFTGRLMHGRRWSDGLHQAIEAKEGLRVQEENQTLATITFQNFFRLYKKLSGMTGTALTEGPEFAKIYGLEVVPIPPNRPLARFSHPDVIYATDAEKVGAVIDEIAEVSSVGRPVLVGTITVERSEMLSERLDRRGIKHVVLNAKYHKKESAIVAQAGEPGAVTIATNMAGRGTDIVLGGNPTLQLQSELETRWEKTETQAKDLINVFRYAQRFVREAPKEPVSIVLPGLHAGEQAVWDPALPPGQSIQRIAKAIGIEVEPEDADKLLKYLNDLEAKADADHDKVVALGGLHIVGTERHEARRIDNQLRGRAGRQGDPGSSRFFLSLEDDLMRIFMGEWVRRFMQKAGLRDGQPIESGMVSRAIERAQKKVEEQNFTMRKHVLEYDEVMDEQRKLVYGERQAVLEAFRERQPELIARDLIAELIEPQWLDGERIEVSRSFEPVHDALRETVDTDVSEEDWRRLGFREFCEHAAALASAHRPTEDEILAAAKKAVGEALGGFDGVRRWNPDAQKAFAKERGFTLEAAWPAVFGELLAKRLAEAVEPAAPKDMIAEWVERGLEADLALVAGARWEFDAYQRWIGDLPCEINGAEWGPLLARTEKIAPLVTERLGQGLGSRAAAQVSQALVAASVRTYLSSPVFLRRPSAARVALWADYRLGLAITAEEVEGLADEAAERLATATAASKAREISTIEGLTLHWHFPKVAGAVRATLAGEGRDFRALAARLNRDFFVDADAFDLSKLDGGTLLRAMTDLIGQSKAPKIHCAGLDEIVHRTFLAVIDGSVAEYVDPEQVPEERSFAPVARWADSLGLHVSRDEWAELSREELLVLFSQQVRRLPEAELTDFARGCVRSSVEHFLLSESFAQDRSYGHLAAWARGRFSFAGSPGKLETTVSRKVDARRAAAREQMIQAVVKSLAADGKEQAEVADTMVGAALTAYFMTNQPGEEIELEPLARWVNSKLRVSAPASRMEELMDADERSLTNFVCERARPVLVKQRTEKVVGDALTAALDCFMPPETFPDTWLIDEMDEWAKKCGFQAQLDPFRLAEGVRSDILDVFVEDTMSAYAERSAQAVALDAARYAAATFLQADLAEAGRNFAGLAARLNRKFNLDLDPFELSKLAPDDIRERAERLAFEALDARTEKMGPHVFHWIERVLILQAIDTRWRDHLAVMDSLKSGIGLRGYAQVDPKIAYKKEGYEEFQTMIGAIHEEVSDMLLKVEIDLGTEVHERETGVQTVHGSVTAYQREQQQAIAASQKSDGGRRPVRAEKQPNRNDPCPCGSGKKYKNCCMNKG